MNKITFNVLLAFFALQASVARAQNWQQNEPRFKLKTSLIYPGILGVDETNISNETLREPPCYERQGIFKISVLYNGEPLQERDPEVRKKREEEVKLTRCKQKFIELKPGDFQPRYLHIELDYPMKEPGTYEVTVSRESDPEHPEKSVTVKSNTLTLVVNAAGKMTAQK